MSQRTTTDYFTLSLCFCISIQYLTDDLLIGCTRYHTFKLAVAFIQSLVVSWTCPFFTAKMFLQGLMYIESVLNIKIVSSFNIYLYDITHTVTMHTLVNTTGTLHTHAYT